MTYTFMLEGWQDWNGNRHEGDPVDLEETQGVFVYAFDKSDPSNEHWFWVYVGEEFESWDEWWVLVGAMMNMHGMEIG